MPATSATPIQFIHCNSINELKILPKSQKDRLLSALLPRDKATERQRVGFKVGDDEYEVTADDNKVQTRRLGLRTSPAERFIQCLVELFTHRIRDFLSLRAMGSRASHINDVMCEWINPRDGQESAEGATRVRTPTMKFQGPGFTSTISRADHAHRQENHAPAQIQRISLDAKPTPLSATQRNWFFELTDKLHPHAKGKRGAERPLLDVGRIEDAARTALQANLARNGGAVQGAAFDDAYAPLMAALRAAASVSKETHAAGAPPLVYEARLLALVRVFTAHQWTPQRALEVLTALQTPGALHDLEGRSETAMNCWKAARLLCGSAFGLDLLDECVAPPEGMSEPVQQQWRTALKLYLSASDALIAQSSDAQRQYCDAFQPLLARGTDGLTAGSLEAQLVEAQKKFGALRHALHAWHTSPAVAAHCAKAFVNDPANAGSNLLAHRALLGAVKLLKAREYVDTAWLERKRPYAQRTLVPDRKEVLALAMWRNGYRDDREGSPLDEFSAQLRRGIHEWMPRSEVEPKTGEVREYMPKDSPIAVAFENGFTAAVTLRPVKQQAEDFDTSVGIMARLLVAELKEMQDVELAPHEALMQEVLATREAILERMSGANQSEKEALEARFEEIVRKVDGAARIEALWQNSSLSEEHRHLFRESRLLGDCSEDELSHARELLSYEKVEFPDLQVLNFSSYPDASTSQPDTARAVRISLLNHWLYWTETGRRSGPYEIDEGIRNAVIGDLIDDRALKPHALEIEGELKKIPSYIDLALLKTWANEAGLLMQAPASSHRGGLFRVHGEIVDIIKNGGSKIDARAKHDKEALLRTRGNLGLALRDRADVNLGASFTGETTKITGLKHSNTIDTSNAVPGVGIGSSVTVAGEIRAGIVQRFSSASSTVGGATDTFSTIETGSTQIGLDVKAKTGMLSAGVDGNLGESNQSENGIHLRSPQKPGSRSWVEERKRLHSVLVSQSLREAAAADADTATGPKHQTIAALCWHSIAPLLTGDSALNRFVNLSSSETLSSGTSVGFGATLFTAGSVDMLTASASLRLGKETDRALRQSKVDLYGSTRVEAHSIGEASRMSVALKLLLSLLSGSPAKYLGTSLSMGSVAGITAIFAERGIQQAVRREIRDGMILPSTAWDITFRNAQDFVNYMSQPNVHAEWDQHFSVQEMRTRGSLDEVLKTAKYHASACNQTFLVRRHLKPEKLAQLNALKAIEQTLTGTKGFISSIKETLEIDSQCRDLMDNPDHYEPGGLGIYAAERIDYQEGSEGSVIATQGTGATMTTEMAWNSARLTPKQREKLQAHLR
jgi:hypothetical protein